MEKSVLKTLIYADIFYYPMKAWEIHKWLIIQSLTLRQVEQTLKKLARKNRVDLKNDLYFLKGRQQIVYKRLNKQKSSNYFLRKAKILTAPLRLISWVKLMGVSGGLAMDNADKDDDIDLFIVVQEGRLWLARFLILIYLDFLGARRRRGDKKNDVSGKFCVNLILEEDNLEQKNKDLFTAHEVLQMKLIWQKENIYQRYLEENEWAFNFLPNWSSREMSEKLKYKKDLTPSSLLVDIVEFFVRKLQLNIMKKPLGLERIERGGLYLHPQDYRLKVLQQYKQRLAKY